MTVSYTFSCWPPNMCYTKRGSIEAYHTWADKINLLASQRIGQLEIK